MRLSIIIFIVFIVLFTDWYYFRAVKRVIQNQSPKLKKFIQLSYWIVTLLVLISIGFVIFYFEDKAAIPKIFRIYGFGIILIITVSKIIGALFLIIRDIVSLFLFSKKQVLKKMNPHQTVNVIPRRDFLKKTAIIASIIPFGTLMFGVIKSAFDFTIRKQRLVIKNLPPSFKGLKIIQISDIHIGSFMSEKPVQKAVDLIKQQHADVIFFTGDLVNDITEEALPFIDVLKQISAPMGVFSILGNHDYGDYFYKKDDLKGKQHNYKLMQEVHQKLGWKLLLNQNHILTRGEDRLAILGVENWGAMVRFPKLGDIDLAKKGTLDSDVKLLLSHDPSHWEEKVLPNHPDISATFSGHTHGMQFGIEIPGFKWSPSKYIYKNWAGYYQKEGQQIYVNRGLGFLGYPGRVGILPEITVFELT